MLRNWAIRQGGGSSGPPLANMAAWYPKGVGITAPGNSVVTWADASGNGRTLIQLTGTNQPQLQGDGTILFDGIDDNLKTAGFTLNQPETVYLRMRQVTYTTADYFFDGNSNQRGILFQSGVSPTVALFAGSQAADSNALAINTYGSVACVFNGASSVLQIGATITTGNAGAANLGGFTLGAGGTPSNYSNIQVAEVILYDVAHDAATRAQVIAYLDTK